MRLAAVLANRLIARDAWARGQLAAQAGKVARIRCGPLSADFRIADDGHLVSVAAALPDATLTVPVASILDAAEFPDQAAATIEVIGDPEVGAVLVGVARVTPWLAESELARLAGPIAAQRVAGAIRAAFRVPRYAAARLGENTRSYFRDETSAVVRRRELEGHAQAVGELDHRLEELLTRADAAGARRSAPKPVASER